MTTRWAAGAAIGAALLLAGCGGTSAASSTPTPTPTKPPYESILHDAYDSCQVSTTDATDDVTVADNGHTVTLKSVDQSRISGLSVDTMECVLKKFGSPASVIDQMWQTRALDGMQHASWGTTKATWTYHPDSGLQVILTDQ